MEEKFNWITQLLIGIITVKNESIFTPIPSTAVLTIRIKMLLSTDTRIWKATSMICRRRSNTYIIVFYLRPTDIYLLIYYTVVPVQR